MKTFTRDDVQGFLSAKDLKSESVDIPQWGYKFIVRELTGTERDEYETSTVKLNGSEVSLDTRNMRAKLVALCVVDKDGERLFTQDDVEALGNRSASGLDLLFDVAKRLSRIGEDELENLGKVLKPTKSGDSASL